MSKIIKLCLCCLLISALFGCSSAKTNSEQTEEDVKETDVIEETIEEETPAEEAPAFPITLDIEQVYDWIELYHGEWEWETGKSDSSSMCMDGSNAIMITIGHGDSDDFEHAYNISQCTGCCNDGIAYKISSIDQIDEETYEVHLENYVINMPEDAGRSYQNYTLLPTDTYIIRKGNDDKTIFMQFKGLNVDTYKSSPDGDYMSSYEELYLGADDWYEFKLYWKDGQSIEH